MLSGFPDQAANDPEGYIAGLITIAGLFPEQAVTSVVERSFPFLPSRFQWRQALEEEAVRLMRIRAAANARAFELPPVEYETLRLPPDPDVDPITGKHPAGTILRQYGRWVGLYGRPYDRAT